MNRVWRDSLVGLRSRSKSAADLFLPNFYLLTLLLDLHEILREMSMLETNRNLCNVRPIGCQCLSRGTLANGRLIVPARSTSPCCNQPKL